jgi:hypothetical protein
MVVKSVDAADSGQIAARKFFSITSEKLFQSNEDELAKSRKMRRKQRPRKKLRRQGAQIMRNEVYFYVRRNDEGCRATQHPDFLRSR